MSSSDPLVGTPCRPIAATLARSHSQPTLLALLEMRLPKSTSRLAMPKYWPRAAQPTGPSLTSCTVSPNGPGGTSPSGSAATLLARSVRGILEHGGLMVILCPPLVLVAPRAQPTRLLVPAKRQASSPRGCPADCARGHVAALPTTGAGRAVLLLLLSPARILASVRPLAPGWRAPGWFVRARARTFVRPGRLGARRPCSAECAREGYFGAF